MKIALFGGSFNPFHYDHLLICKYLYKKEKFNEIWIIPTKNHPFDKKIEIQDNHRINMIKLMIKKYKYIKLNLFELENKNSISYSYNTIFNFTNIFPNINFSLIVGTDTIETIHKWYKINEIFELINIIAIKRKYEIKNMNSFSDNIKKYKINIIEIKNLLGFSSTDIRNGFNITKKTKYINQYINNNALYLNSRLKNNLNDIDRYKHSINVGNMAFKLAIAHKIANLNDILIAGTLHDITKNWSYDKHIEYIQKYCPEFINEPIPTLHSYSAFAYLKYELFYNDTITYAIKKHTTASPMMSKIEQVIFIADKISSERKNDNMEFLRKESFKNLKSAFIIILQNQYIIALKKNGLNNIGKQIIKSINKWKKK